ncbi:MAG TPA: sporulation peptidase YabG, partial [Desulfotomaculum sp.]|nr:sporulation peptidase YabG [Desulfotomaculum sp.]
MSSFRKGDLVGRRSYNMDVIFKIIYFFTKDDGSEHAALKGVDYRLVCDAPLSDLVPLKPEEIAARWRQVLMRNSEIIRRSLSRRKNDLQSMRSEQNLESFAVPGTVLHIDGDRDYLELCLSTYKQMAVPVNAFVIPEERQPEAVGDLLPKYLPDIIVVTGHDSFLPGKRDFQDLNSYRNSRHFVAAVKAARAFEHDRDALVIFAGACQSHYEALLEAGANFASSPQRVLIHAFDPVFIAERVAYTPVSEQVRIGEAIEHTISGYSGIGGIQTQGRHRRGVPK